MNNMKVGKPNPRTGFRLRTWTDEKGRFCWQEEYVLNDRYAVEAAKYFRERQDILGPVEGEFLQAFHLPHALRETLIMNNGDGTRVDIRDPDYAKRIRKFANDIDYRRLRTSDGTF